VTGDAVDQHVSHLTSERLREVLSSLGGSLLQYSRHCSPWVPHHAEPTLAALMKLVERQGDSIREMAESLGINVVDFAARSSDDFTDMHYVSLDFLVERIIADQSRRVARLKADVVDLEIGLPPLARQILDREIVILDELRSLKRQLDNPP
jgi:hypothetical protein